MTGFQTPSSTVVRVAEPDYTALRGSLADAGFRIFELDGSAVHDRLSFFQQAYRAWPMGSALQNPTERYYRPEDWNWDAFNDFLFQGLTDQDRQPVALVWLAAGSSKRVAAVTLDTVVECVEFVVEQNLAHNPDAPNRVHLVLVGAGPEAP